MSETETCSLSREPGHPDGDCAMACCGGCVLHGHQGDDCSRYRVEIWDGHTWSDEAAGDPGRLLSLEEARNDIEGLRALGDGWERNQYRILNVHTMDVEEYVSPEAASVDNEPDLGR